MEAPPVTVNVARTSLVALYPIFLQGSPHDEGAIIRRDSRTGCGCDAEEASEPWIVVVETPSWNELAVTHILFDIQPPRHLLDWIDHPIVVPVEFLKVIVQEVVRVGIP